jgi:hypothetical protein
MESLTTVIEELKSAPNLAEIVEEELRTLTKKLPDELASVDTAIDVHDAAWVQALVESASAEIQGRLQTLEAGP